MTDAELDAIEHRFLVKDFTEWDDSEKLIAEVRVLRSLLLPFAEECPDEMSAKIDVETIADYAKDGKICTPSHEAYMPLHHFVRAAAHLGLVDGQAEPWRTLLDDERRGLFTVEPKNCR